LKNYLIKIFDAAKVKLPYLNEIDPLFTVPSQQDHGDYATNAAMLLAKKLKKKPLDISKEIVDNLDYDRNIILKIEIAGPGFINFYFSPSFNTQIIKQILSLSESSESQINTPGKKQWSSLFRQILPDRLP